jgi:hypothetical protein
MRKKIIIVLLLYLISLSGCATAVKSIGHGEKIALSENEAFVFGKIVFVENGTETLPYSSRRNPFLSIFQVESEKRVRSLFPEKDGAFYWIVPRGTYLVNTITYRDAWFGTQGSYILQPQVVFQTPSGADAFYMGTLIIDAEVGKHLLGEVYLKKVNSIRVVDEFDKAKEAVISANPELAKRMVKNLMIHDRSLPVDPQLQNKKDLIDILGIIGLHLLTQYNIQHFP